MSSNIGISILGTRLSPAVRYDYMRKFGLGEKTAVDFQGETPGILHKTWDSQTKYNVTYGQGVSASDAQVHRHLPDPRQRRDATAAHPRGELHEAGRHRR